MMKYCRILIERKNFPAQFLDKIKNRILIIKQYSENSSENPETRGTAKYGKIDNINKVFALSAVYRRQETHTQNM
jgi:hypothetical protein